MTLICFASQKGSPGATATALAVAASLQVAEGRRKVLLEADATGGTLAIRYRLPVEPGLLTLAAAVRGGLEDSDGLWRHTQELPGGLSVIVCPDGPDQVHAALAAGGAQLGRFLNSLRDVDVMCDVGRLAPDSPALPFAAEASAVLMVARPTAEQLQPAARRMLMLRPLVSNLGWVLVGQKPYGPLDVESTYDFPVVGVMADDPRSVLSLERGTVTKRLRRQPFIRSATTLADTLSEWLSPLTTAEEASAGSDRKAARPAEVTGDDLAPLEDTGVFSDEDTEALPEEYPVVGSVEDTVDLLALPPPTGEPDAGLPTPPAPLEPPDEVEPADPLASGTRSQWVVVESAHLIDGPSTDDGAPDGPMDNTVVFDPDGGPATVPFGFGPSWSDPPPPQPAPVGARLLPPAGPETGEEADSGTPPAVADGLAGFAGFEPPVGLGWESIPPGPDPGQTASSSPVLDSEPPHPPSSLAIDAEISQDGREEPQPVRTEPPMPPMPTQPPLPPPSAQLPAARTKDPVDESATSRSPFPDEEADGEWSDW